MRRSLVLASVLAVSTAVFGACNSGTNTTPTKGGNNPVSTPTPVEPATPTPKPVASPSIDPKASPGKPGASPEVKKDDKKAGDTNKDAKPVTKETPKK